MTNIIVDTSVVTKWYAQKEEGDLEPAFRLLDACSEGELTLICPTIILLELANVLYLGKKLDRTLCLASVRSLENLCTKLVDIDDAERIVTIMYDHALASYDAAFVSLAIAENIPLVTADYKHHKKSISPHIVWLSEFTP